MEQTRQKLQIELSKVKNDVTTLNKMQKMIDNMLKSSIDELKNIKTQLKFIEISDVLKTDGYKLIGLTKNDAGYEIEYQKIDDDTKTYKMMYNNYKYYGCRSENAKIKQYEEDYYNRLVRLFGTTERQIKLDGLKLKRPLFIDFKVNFNENVVYIEIDESRRHFDDNDEIQKLRDFTKDNYINTHNLKLLRIDPVGSDFTDAMLIESVKKLVDSDENILKIGKRYWN